MNIVGRGEHVRLCFETGTAYADTTWQENCNEIIVGYIDEDSTTSETREPAILRASVPEARRPAHLPDEQYPDLHRARIGLAPRRGSGIWKLNALVLTALGGLSNEVQDCHPVAHDLYYEEQKDESLWRSKD
ncbi:hypothetical protein GGR52DRAFT_572314 [Hypoxylon sp. FL1284]|nr:hypothetical protein GGR52DRAFT_572314 [Hypoxylon sp. FL1284]